MNYDLFLNVHLTYDKIYDELCLALGLKFPEFFLDRMNSFSGIDFTLANTSENSAYYYPESGGVSWDSDEYKTCFTEISKLFPACQIVVEIKGEEDDDFRELFAKDGLIYESAGYVMFWTRDEEKAARAAIEKSSLKPSAAVFLS